MFHLKDLRRRNVSSSPYLSSRVFESSPINHPANLPTTTHPVQPISPSSNYHPEVDDVLAPGDIVANGSLLKGDVVSLLSNDSDQPSDEDEDEQFQVLKELGKGSYAVVYLVHQVFSPRSASYTEDGQILGVMDNDPPFPIQPRKTYGRKFAVKCLSKANLDKEELDLQMAEVTIHQSLPLHPNIVALHKTLQTSSYLLLILEYVPGQDLFYFLEQAKDHYPSPPPSPIPSPMLFSPCFPVPDPPVCPSQQGHHTPPTPSLLSSLHPSHLLSRTRLRLIASMFAQMCDAVAACHAVGVFHRDIKPENFIVTDGRYVDEGIIGANNKGRVVVKLTDFGLSTKEEECADMDCGSAPYMSYECRNNIAPTYRPRDADVWSLGIVLINMLYHINPWTDTAHDACPSFAAFRQDPVTFFVRLFTGMTHGFAEVLARRVFCIDDGRTRVNGRVKEKRMTAAELGLWVRSNLVDLLATDDCVTSSAGLNGVVSTIRPVVNGGHRLSLQMRISHRPVSRAASPFGGRLGSVGGCGGIGNAVASPRMPAMSLSRAPSLTPALEKEEVEARIAGRLRVQVVEELKEQEQEQEQEQDQEQEQEHMQHQEEDTEHTAGTPSSRTSTTTKRRKRGLRNRGKGSISTVGAIKSQPQEQQQEETLQTLADASQSLAREISNASRPSVHQLVIQQHQPSSLLLTPVSGHNHGNGIGRRMSSASALSSTSSACTGDSCASGESCTTVLTSATTVPSPSMAITTPGTTSTRTTESKPSFVSLALMSAANSSDSTRTASKGSSSRTPITKTASNGSSNSRPSRRYEPVSMYALPSALLSKPMHSSSGTVHSVGSGSGTQTRSPQPSQPPPPPVEVVAKKSSKWTLRFGKNNNSGGGGNNSPASASTTSSVFSMAPAHSPVEASPVPTLSASRPIPIPTGGSGHASAFTAPSPTGFEHNVPSLMPTQVPAMSPTATNVTNLIMGLNPGFAQPHHHQNDSSGSLVGGRPGGGYASSSTPWSSGRRGRSGTDSMLLSPGGGGSSLYKPKSRSPGPGTSPGAPSRTGGLGSSASSSTASLISGASSWVDQGQGQGRSPQDGWDKWSSDRMGNRVLGLNRGVSGAAGGAPGGATGFGAGGGRHGSVGAAGGPFASSASSVMGVGGGRRSAGSTGSAISSSMSAMSANTSTSWNGGANPAASGTASGSVSPGGSTSMFTRYSNSSLRSVSTAATSVSSGSAKANWRHGGRGGAAVTMPSPSFSDLDGGLESPRTSAVGGKTNPYAGLNLPKSVKIMDGIPWALNELPRGQHPNPDFGSPPVRKTRTRNKKRINNNSNNANSPTTDSQPSTPTAAGSSTSTNVTNKLDTIIERPLGVGLGQQEDSISPISPTTSVESPGPWRHASTSTTDLVAVANATTPAANDEVTGGRIKKVHKGQINTLAKMLSALRREK